MLIKSKDFGTDALIQFGVLSEVALVITIVQSWICHTVSSEPNLFEKHLGCGVERPGIEFFRWRIDAVRYKEYFTKKHHHQNQKVTCQFRVAACGEKINNNCYPSVYFYYPAAPLCLTRECTCKGTAERCLLNLHTHPDHAPS